MRTVTLTLGGLALELAPTPLARLAKAAAFLQDGAADEQAVEGLCEAIFWGLRRAKQEVTLDFVVDNVDALNQDDVIAAFLDKPAKITLQEIEVAALAAAVYAAKKFLFPDTTF